MPQSAPGDLERGNNRDGDQTQSAPNQQSKEARKEPTFGDSSGPFFSIYSKAAEEEDNKMVERWQKDADGILIFTGLFSAAVAALLGVTIQDLRPNTQDNSAFYLGNIYGVLADPNVTRASIPSPVAKPPPFSRPRYAVWVNSLWFLSLVMSLSCALLATSLHQWARRYIRLTQPARQTPEKRARMRAFYANGVDSMHVSLAVEGLPTLLHLSVFLFFGGLAIFLFNVDDEVFTCVACWIGFFLIVYGLITLMPLIRHKSPYYTPLSKPVWYLYASIAYLTFTVLAFFADRFFTYWIWDLCADLKDNYRGWISDGMEKAAEKAAEKWSSEIDIRIFGWTIGALGDDDSLENFFEAIPGLFKSKLSKGLVSNFPETLFYTFWDALDSFIYRTRSSNSVSESTGSRRVNIWKDIASTIPRPFNSSFPELYDQDQVSTEKSRVMARWRTNVSGIVSNAARIRAAKTLARIQERDDRWITLASDVSGISENLLQHDIALAGDNMLLAIVIDTYRRDFQANKFALSGFTEGFREFDIRHTFPGLQHDFCTLWNELVQEAKNQGPRSNPVYILCEIRQLYISLHQDTDASPTAFSASTDRFDDILYQPSSYPLCNLASHRPDSAPHVPIADSPAVRPVPQQVKEVSIIAGPSSPSDATTPGSQVPTATEPTKPVPTNSHNTDLPPSGAVAVVPQDTSPAAISSHTLEGTTQQDIVAAGPVSASDPLHPASSVANPPIPAFPSPSHVPPLHHAESAESLVLLSRGTTPSRPTGHATLPRLRIRGISNTGGVYFANAVLQLLLHSPPFWNLFRELVYLKGQRGAEDPESGGGATPLVDATVRFFEEFMFEEKEPPSLQEPPQQAASGRFSEEKEQKKVADSFEPTYLYDAMREKRQLKDLLDGKNENAEEVLCLYLDALDEEFELHTYISTHKPFSASSIEKLKEGAQLVEGQTMAGKRDYTASSAESPVSRIFGGKSRSTVRVPSQPDTVNIEAWRSLRLNIQPNSVHSIQDALEHISQPRPVQVGQSSSSEARQQVLLETLPPILVFHLERFLYEATTEGIVKLGKPVRFAPELEIPLEMMAPISGKSPELVHYKLHGVLYHHGESAGGGHYTVNVLHQNGDNDGGEVWLHIDDEAVSTVRYEDVFGNHENERRVDDGCAYMLFYCRTASTQT